MQQIADLHIHSKYSRACSRELTLEGLDQACRTKGVDIIATGDFTFPAWLSDIKNKLEEVKTGDGKESGFYRLKSASDDKVKFTLATELALIYKKFDKVRRIHIMVQAPNLAAAQELIGYLEERSFNLRSDGRPILGLDAEKLMEVCVGIHPQFLVYPAHIWTPWFAVFGSKSGFNHMEECFGDWTEYVYAYETGLSSDPEMNWRLSELDKYTLLSNSDAHSLPNIAREATVFDLKDRTYNELFRAIKNKDKERIKYTIEFYPEEGMYHYDGHRACGVSMTPEETKKNKGICPVCKKPLTVGVMNRVDELADRELGFRPKDAYGYVKLVELDKIIAEALNIKSRKSKKVQEIYHYLVSEFGSEMEILLSTDPEKVGELADPAIGEALKRVKNGKLVVEPGFDGQYGLVKIFSSEEHKQNKQGRLF
jgi:uncharacterized protein (TIGR00375 family)